MAYNAVINCIPGPHYPGNSRLLAGIYPGIYRILCPRRPGTYRGLMRGDISFKRNGNLPRDVLKGTPVYAWSLISIGIQVINTLDSKMAVLQHTRGKLNYPDPSVLSSCDKIIRILLDFCEQLAF